MSSFKTLREIITFKGGGTPSKSVSEYWGGEIPWATVKDFTSTALTTTQDAITEAGLKSSSANLIPRGHVIIPTRMALGKAAINYIDLAINQDLRALIPKAPMDPSYLLHAVLSLKETIVRKGSGATVKGITQEELYDLEIFFPPLDDQIRIAHLLGKVEGLIVQRKQHLQQLDDLIKSVFLEMFGPSCQGYDAWPLVEIRDLAANHKGAMRTGPFGSNLLHSEFTAEGDVAVLGIDNAVQNRFAWGERRFISNEKYQELENYRVSPGDVIVTIMGTIGRSAVVPDDVPLAVNTKHLAAITLNREVANPLFLSYSIHSSPFILNQFRSKNRGAIMSGLNLGLIKETKLKRPPIELQEKFAETHTRVDELKAMYQYSLTDLETLYSALSQQAFKGELDLSRVPLPDEQAQPGQGGRDVQQQADPLPISAGAITPTEVTNQMVQPTPPQVRRALLVDWLRQYLTNTLPDASLDTAQLIESAWQALQSTRSKVEGDTLTMASEDYDALRGFLLEALDAGDLEQYFDGDSNRVGLKPGARLAAYGSW